MNSNVLVITRLDFDGSNVAAIFGSALSARQLAYEPWSVKQIGGDVILRLSRTPDETEPLYFTSAELRAFKMSNDDIRRRVDQYLDSILPAAAEPVS